MPSIEVDDEVYAALQADQQEGETLSQVVGRWFDQADVDSAVALIGE